MNRTMKPFYRLESSGALEAVNFPVENHPDVGGKLLARSDTAPLVLRHLDMKRA
jgi:hypothetical protein